MKASQRPACTGWLRLLVVICGSAAVAACDPAGPGPIALEDGFSAVSAGGAHTCAITRRGSVFCWGSNAQGQLGTGSGRSVATPARIAGSIVAAAVSAGASHTCAIDEAGQLWCWGENAWGQLGTGFRQSSATPVAVAPLEHFREVSAGSAHTCAITLDDRALCWGASTHGQAGADGGEVMEPREVAPQLRFAAISAGGMHTCGIDADGVALCWGRNTRAQLGDGTTEGRADPAPILGGRRYIGIAAGYEHTCAVLADTQMQCWGSNEHGELGEGVAPDRVHPGGPGAYFPYPVQGMVRAQQVTAGRYISCGLLQPDTMENAWCWGRGGDGEIGTGGWNDHYVAQRVRHPDLSWERLRFRQIDAGYGHVCGVADTASIFCWGRGESGQLGTGSFTGSALPVRVPEGL